MHFRKIRHCVRDIRAKIRVYDIRLFFRLKNFIAIRCLTDGFLLICDLYLPTKENQLSDRQLRYRRPAETPQSAVIFRRANFANRSHILRVFRSALISKQVSKLRSVTQEEYRNCNHCRGTPDIITHKFMLLRRAKGPTNSQKLVNRKKNCSVARRRSGGCCFASIAHSKKIKFDSRVVRQGDLAVRLTEKLQA